MKTPIFERETWLDVTVNIIPIFIIGFFIALFVVVSPWGLGGLDSLLTFGLLVVPIVSLAALTYFAAKAIE